MIFKFRNNVLVLVLIFLTGCFTNHNKANYSPEISLLTNDSLKYWKFYSDTLLLPKEEAGFVFFKNGKVLSYEQTDMKRIYPDISSQDIFCDTSEFKITKDTFYFEECGWTYKFKIICLNEDTLELRELTNYHFFPPNIRIIYLKSSIQSSLATSN